MERNEFDTIYHEHFSYFSMLTTAAILRSHGLRVFDVDELPTHGGSLRVYACRAENQIRKRSKRASSVSFELEKEAGLDSPAGYRGLQNKFDKPSSLWSSFSSRRYGQGKTVAGYGAPGKSATLLHYCGIGKDLIEYTVDRSPVQTRPIPARNSYTHLSSRIEFARQSLTTLSSSPGI